MSTFKKYSLNSETLLYEIKEVSVKSRFIKSALTLLSSIGVAFLYFWLFTRVFNMDLPKTAILKMKNSAWVSKIEIMSRQIDKYDAALEGLQMRDDNIYRSIFGMNEISSEMRNSGFGNMNRYSELDKYPGSGSLLKKTTVRVDVLTKKSFIQSKSFDEVVVLSKRAGDLASCIPAIPPISTEPGSYRLSSPFGYRTDPITGATKMHSGLDFACPPGNSVYVTGDGIVESVRYDLFGYGNSIVVDHGFGYKTRYAHLKLILVKVGMSLKRGDMIAETGNSGRSTGPHLHYEVMYRGNFVNPYNYFDMSMPSEEYASMVRTLSN